MYTKKQLNKILTEIKYHAARGVYVKDIAKELGFSYQSIMNFIIRYNIDYTKENKASPIRTKAKKLIRKSKTVPCLKIAYDYIHNNTSIEEQDELLDLLLDKQKEIRDAYQESKT